LWERRGGKAKAKTKEKKKKSRAEKVTDIGKAKGELVRIGRSSIWSREEGKRGVNVTNL